jgi:hypothetical protein
MVEAMILSTYSRRIDEVLSSRERNAPQADVLFDQYTTLISEDEREAFVAALIHRILLETARKRHPRTAI